MRLVLLPLVLITALACAQSWCPPGANWNYEISGYFIGGNVVHTYEGDTVLDGYVAQRIKRRGVLLNYQWGDPPLQQPIDDWRYTAMVDSTLLVRLHSAPYTWDTLFHFDAVIGDRWWPP
jgi:hypothetical protein